MRKKELRIVNLVLLAIVLIASTVTLRLSVNGSLLSIAQSFWQPKENVQAKTTETEVAKCPDKPKLQLANHQKEPHLKRLDAYQQVCGSFVTNQLMIFTNFPKDDAEAQLMSTQMAGKLKQFTAAGVSPIVIVEPYVGDQAMSYHEYLGGRYDAAVDAYFRGLKSAGVTDNMMGMWVPFPETNTPNWNNKDTEPRDFSLCVNRYLRSMVSQFPKAKGSVLLNATTYEPTDLEWENGDYISLVPYLQNLDRKLVTSVGIQGFPWVSSAQQTRREIFKAQEFLQPDLAIEAARELRTRDIWFNTGSFAAKYTNDRTKRVEISANERKAIMRDILDAAKLVQNYQQNEYRVMVNVFGEDKSGTREATDWSYFQDEDTRAVFREFIAKANELQIPISLFDRAK